MESTASNFALSHLVPLYLNPVGWFLSDTVQLYGFQTLSYYRKWVFLQVMQAFRTGGYNTLVSTCVGEEGLDIGDVDLIVCFDAHKSPIRLVQRMGRTGRKRQGRIVMLVTEGKEEQARTVGTVWWRLLTQSVLALFSDIRARWNALCRSSKSFILLYCSPLLASEGCAASRGCEAGWRWGVAACIEG